MSASSVQRAVIYCRVSTEEQAETGTSLDAQEFACLRRAAELGASVVGIHRDEGVSGGFYLTRPGVQAALADIEAGRANLLIVAKRDRLARDVDAARDIQRRLSRAGARVISCDGMSFDDNAVGRLMATQIDSFAEYEKAIIRERTVLGRRRRAEEGKQPCRAMHPYGYRIVGERDALAGLYPAERIGEYVIVEEEAQWIREAFALYAGGSSLREVCRFLNERAVPTPRHGDYWRPSTLKRILQNPVYRGQATFGRHERHTEEVRTEDGPRRRTSIRQRTEEHWTYIECPALVDEQTWRACNERLAEGRSLYGGNPERKHLLSGILRCPVCGRGMGGTRRERHGKTEHHYHCLHARPSRNPGKVTCDRTHYDAETAERILTEAAYAVAERPEMVAAAIEAWQQKQRRTDAVQDRAALRRDLEKLQQRERAAIQAQIQGIEAGADPSAYVSVLGDIAGQKAALVAKLAAADAVEVQAAADPMSEAEVYAAQFAKLRRVMESPRITTAQKHDVLAGLFRSAVPDGEGYCITLRPLSTPQTVANILILATVCGVREVRVADTEAGEQRAA